MLIECLLGYQDHLDSQNKKMRLSHDSCFPVRKFSESLSIEIILKNQFVAPCHKSLSIRLYRKLKHISISLWENLPY